MRPRTLGRSAILLPLALAAPFAVVPVAHADPDASCNMQGAGDCQIDFASTAVGDTSTLTVTFTNIDIVTVENFAVDISDGDAAEFSQADVDCDGAVVDAGDSCSIDITYAPAGGRGGDYSSTADLTLSGAGVDNSGTVTGSATDVPGTTPSVTPTPTLTATPSVTPTPTATVTAPTPSPSPTPSAVPTIPFTFPPTVPITFPPFTFPPTVPPTVPVITFPPTIPVTIPVTVPPTPTATTLPTIPITIPVTIPVLPTPTPTATATPTPVATETATATPTVPAPSATLVPTAVATPQPAATSGGTIVTTSSSGTTFLGGGLFTTLPSGGSVDDSGAISTFFVQTRNRVSSVVVEPESGRNVTVTSISTSKVSPIASAQTASLISGGVGGIITAGSGGGVAFDQRLTGGFTPTSASPAGLAARAATVPTCKVGVPVTGKCTIPVVLPKLAAGLYRTTVHATTTAGDLTIPTIIAVRPSLSVKPTTAVCDDPALATTIRAPKKAELRWTLRRVLMLGGCPASAAKAASAKAAPTVLASGKTTNGTRTIRSLVGAKAYDRLAPGIYRVAIAARRNLIISAQADLYFRVR